MAKNNKFEWDQFIKLGDMMGDGLHHEPDGKWIIKEYRRLSKLLVPEIAEAEKAKKVERKKNIDKAVAKLLEKEKCNCGGRLYQKRSGTRVLYCTLCPLKYKLKTSKKKK